MNNNVFHWIVDVTFREDDLSIRIGNSPQNTAVLGHLALNILKLEHPKAHYLPNATKLPLKIPSGFLYWLNFDAFALTELTEYPSGWLKLRL